MTVEPYLHISGIFLLFLKNSDDHRMLVEPACGAALAAVYAGTLGRLQEESKLESLKTIVIIVCGGHAVTISQLQSWQQQVGL